MKSLKKEQCIQKQLFDLLFHIRGKMKDVVQDADAGLSAMQILVLRLLVEEGELSQTALVQKIGRDKSQVTRLVQELEEKRLLTRERNKQDKRSFILKPSKEVQEKVTFFIGREQEMVTEMLADIPLDEVQKLEVILHKMNENLKKGHSK